MYIVANISKSILSLSDLNITIPPNQSRDLHKLPLPIKPDKSIDLQAAIKKGYVKVIKKDQKRKRRPPDNIVVNNNEGIDKETLAKVLRKELSKMNVKTDTPPSPTPAPQTVDQTEVMQQMMAMMKQMQAVIQKQQSSRSGSENEFNYDDIDIDQLSKIHSKAVEKLTKDVENSIEYQQEKTKDSGLVSRADELDDIL